MRAILMTIGLSMLFPVGPALADEITGNPVTETDLPECGGLYAEPFADRADGAVKRPCETPTPRKYVRRYNGIGHEVLDLESEVCFVPDSEYKLLDDIIDDVSVGVSKPNESTPLSSSRVLEIANATDKVLFERGFALYIPTDTLGDALYSKSEPQQTPRYVSDCDTTSLILLTVAEALDAPGHLVEIALNSRSTHNFVRWELGAGKKVEWDTNGRKQCIMPEGNPPYRGISMSHDQIIAYILMIRGTDWAAKGNWELALADETKSIELAPGHPVAYNNLAWWIATRPVPQRSERLPEAIDLVEKMLAIDRRPQLIDTAACVYAAAGNFTKAASLQEEAVRLAPNDEDLRRHLTFFVGPDPHDCMNE